MSADECRPVEVDGEIISVRGSEPMDAEERVMFGGVVRAARAKVAADRAAHDAEVWDKGYAQALIDDGYVLEGSGYHLRVNPYAAAPESPRTPSTPQPVAVTHTSADSAREDES